MHNMHLTEAAMKILQGVCLNKKNLRTPLKAILMDVESMNTVEVIY